MIWIFMIIIFISSLIMWKGFKDELMGKIFLFAGICVTAFNILSFVVKFFYYISMGVSIASILALLVCIFIKLFIKK